MNLRAIFLLCVLGIMTVSLCTSPASAYTLDLEELNIWPYWPIDIHGFVSQGYMHSSPNSLYTDSDEGSFDLRDFGVNFAVKPLDNVLVAAQLMGYSVGDQGDDHIQLHYGLVDYRYDDWLGIRGGRIRSTMGLYNETRDIDMLRSSVFLPQAVYPETSREYYASVDAVALYGTFDLDSLGTLSYQAATGDLVNCEDPGSDLTYMLMGMLGASDLDYENGRSSHAQLLWDTPLSIDGLRTSYTWRRIDNTAFLTVPGPGEIEIEVDDYIIWVASAEYTRDKLTAAAEYTENVSDGTHQSTGWYAQLSYEFTDKFSGGVYYGDYESSTATQDTWAVFGKYDITDYWLVKAEIDFNSGNALYPGVDKNGPAQENNVMFAVKTTLYF